MRDMNPEHERQPPIAVVIPTRNRPDQIRRAVESVLANRYERFSLTVVDQSTDGATERVLADHVHEQRIRVLHLDARGASLARNTGLRATQEPLIAFTDDDCAAAPTWLESIAEAFGEADKIGALFGAVMASPEFDTSAGWLPAYLPDRSFTITSPRAMPRAAVMGANMAFRRNVLERIGGFDEQLGPGSPGRSAEDVDALYRALLAGYHARISDEPLITHFGFRPYASGEGARALLDTMYANGSYYGKHIRRGDLVAACVYAAELCHSLGSVIRRARTGQRPLGVQKPAMLLRGVAHGLGARAGRSNSRGILNRAANSSYLVGRSAEDLGADPTRSEARTVTTVVRGGQ